MDSTHKPPSRLIAIGDIHGQSDMLRRLLNVISPQADDQFVFLGDYVDRGKIAGVLSPSLSSFKTTFPIPSSFVATMTSCYLIALLNWGREKAPDSENCQQSFRIAPHRPIWKCL